MIQKKEYYTNLIKGKSFLISGGAGFIGSNLVAYLLNNQAGKVRVLDNFSNGYKKNIDEYLRNSKFELIEGDIRDIETCIHAMKNIDYVSHQAALGSVPRSIKDPKTTNEVNVTGFLNMLIAQKESTSVKRMIYAASSSTYGDSSSLPKIEDNIGKPLSPYAVTKYVNELYADVFSKTYNIETIGLRYFNVFGPKQSPNGAYAAVIPLFMQAIKDDTSPTINGDGNQTRDFTYVDNAVMANVKAFFAPIKAVNQVYNVACGDRISINELWDTLKNISGSKLKANHGPERVGDVKDSLADISKAKKLLNYKVEVPVKKGLELTWVNFNN